MVLAAEIQFAGGKPEVFYPAVEWKTLESSGKSIVLVIRAHELPGILSNEGRRDLCETLTPVANQLAESALDNGTVIGGIQIDYDCATANLAHYHSLINNLRKDLPNVPMSITALPTWLGQPGFEDLVDGLDEFVLQVHSLETPKTIDDKATLCDPARVPGWVDRAAQYGKPFYVALPTYGHELIYDSVTGLFAGLRAEGREDRLASATVRELMADPADIAAIASSLKSNPPPHMRGIVWFRLPVEGDRLNWTWPLLERVMKGEVPEPNLVAEARSPEPGLFEIWIRNEGVVRSMEPVYVAVDWIHSGPMAHDILAGYSSDARTGSSKCTLSGPCPRPGEEVMAAWFRLGGWEGDNRSRFNVGKAVIQP